MFEGYRPILDAFKAMVPASTIDIEVRDAVPYYKIACPALDINKLFYHTSRIHNDFIKR